MTKFITVALIGLLAFPVLAGPKTASTKPRASRKAPTGAAAIANVLRSRKITIDLKSAPLEQFIKYVRVVSGLNIVVLKARIEKDGGDADAIEISLKVKDVRVGDALKLALEGKELGLKIKGNVLLITSKKDALGKPVLKIYSVAHLMVPIRDFPARDMHIYPSNYEPPEEPEEVVNTTYESSEELAELVRNFTGKDTWENEGVTISVFRRHLFVRTYPHVHREIANLFARLPH